MRARRQGISSSVLALCCMLAAWLSLTRAPAAPVARRAAQAAQGTLPHPSGRAAEPGLPPFATSGDGGPSLAIYPPQVVPLLFDHRRHVQQLGMSCTACHDTTARSTSSRDRLLPAGTRCDSCHGTDHRDRSRVTSQAGNPLSSCGACHKGHSGKANEPVARVQIPPPNLKFSHAAHAAQGMACVQCHGEVGEVALASRAQLPRMRACLTCHKGEGPALPGTSQAPSGACATCHLTRGGKMITQFASGSLEPPAWLGGAEHDPDWLRRHASVAGNDSRFCANCHSESSCAACHDGRVRPRNVHPNDFLSMHPVAARQNDASCTSCHRQQSFCLSCHQRAGVTQSGAFGNAAGRGRVHPPKAVWTDGPRTSRHHAWEAQRNLNACASCHVERDCVLCHGTAGVGARASGLGAGSGRGMSPHPNGFRARCGRALRQNARPCLVCHRPEDASLQQCR